MVPTIRESVAGKNPTDGQGSVSYVFDDENLGGMSYGRGTVFMAQPPDASNQNGSQFAISYGDDTAQLDIEAAYTPFGTVREGLEIIDKIAAGIRAGQPVRVFADRTVTPSFVEDVACATEQLIERRPAPGVYHCVNSGVTTWLGIAEEIARVLGRDAELVAVKSTEVTLKARRPVYCALSNEKLAAAGIPMPTWQDALARYVK